MPNNNQFLIGKGKKKTSRKRGKKISVGPPVRQLTTPMQAIETLSKIIKFQQNLTQGAQTITPPQLSTCRTFKPLTSLPRMTGPRPPISVHPNPSKPSLLPTPGTAVPRNTVPSTSGIFQGPGQNAQSNSANSVTQNYSLTQNKETGNSNNPVKNVKPQNVNSRVPQNTNSPNPNANASHWNKNNNRKNDFNFDDIEKDNPSFISFESEVKEINDNNIKTTQSSFGNSSLVNIESEVKELNDDDINKRQSSFGQTGAPKQNLQINFNKKVQQQIVKKTVTEMQQNPQNVKKSDATLDKKSINQTNQETTKEVTQNQESIVNPQPAQSGQKLEKKYEQYKIYYQDPNQRIQFPRGVPKSFLLRQKGLSSIEPQRLNINTDPSIANYIPIIGQNIKKDLNIQTDMNTDKPDAYSPTDVYENSQVNEVREGSESPGALDPGQKRLSAFKRLGPLTQPKKPKLTINLSLSKDQAVREVVDDSYKNIPAYEKECVIMSNDEMVMKYLSYWPWKKHVVYRKVVTARPSKSVMMMEKEQMEEAYDRENTFVVVVVNGYPPSWTKEMLLDILLETLKGKSFIPIFIEFTTEECKFFVLRSRAALLTIHNIGFIIRKDDIELILSIASTHLSLSHIDFVPRLILRKRLLSRYDDESKLDLSEFTLKEDISHFIYFPLNRISNQSELMQLHNTVAWEYLHDLNLSHNRLTTIEGFELEKNTPRLKHLDLSYNYIENIKTLLQCRGLPLRKLNMEGNPMCTDYTDPDHYVKVFRIIFPCLRELDGVPIRIKGDMPIFKPNYCTEDAQIVAEKFLEVFYPFLELSPEERKGVMNMYDEDAILTITYKNSLRYDSDYKYVRKLLNKARVLLDGDFDYVSGASSIGKLFKKWPSVLHDPSTFTVDVMYHTESSTLIKVTGLMKLTAESLAEDEPLVLFSRTVLLHSTNEYEYKIHNEMLYLDEPTKEHANSAFRLAKIPRRTLNFKFESPPDNEIKESLIDLFMKTTDMEKQPSQRCLEEKNWHFKNALEYFTMLLKLDNIQTLM